MLPLHKQYVFPMWFPPGAWKLVPAAGGRAKQEGGTGDFLFLELTVTLLFRSIPGKHILRLLLALPEPTAAEPGQLPQPLHRQPGARPPRTVRTARPRGAMVQ